MTAVSHRLLAVALLPLLAVVGPPAAALFGADPDALLRRDGGGSEALGQEAERGPDRAAPPSWEEVLRRASAAAQGLSYTGEAVWITWVERQPQVAMFEVVSNEDRLVVRLPEQYTVRVGGGVEGLIDHQRGWFVPLPEQVEGNPGGGLGRLVRKYEVHVAGNDRILDRLCTQLEFVRRDDGLLRERVWVDRDSGLMLRRETYGEADVLLRLVSYLSLDLEEPTRDATRAEPAGLQELDRGVTSIQPARLRLLRRAGWAAPSMLPGQYAAVGVYAVSADGTQPLQILYRDGLYSVSLFQQRGRLDPAALPPGAQPARGLSWQAWEWPEAVPARLVWEASGTTYALVGDAPPDDLQAIAEALPQPQAPGLWERLRRGLAKLWEWLSPGR